jgi:ferrochelatase
MTGGATRTGVLVMAYGSPARPEEVEAYYTHIRRGRPPTAEQLADLVARYDAIGGTSPLAERTEAQRAAIERRLDELTPGGFVVRLGQKHAPPFVEDGVAALAADGVERIVGVVLAPHWSAASVGQYDERAATAASDAGVPYAGVERWADLDAFVAHQAAALADALATVVRAGEEHRTKVVFTAHSLPERALVGDPYADELHASARAIATSAGLMPWGDWGLAWQSAGRTPEPWRGPDILVVIDELAETGRADALVVVPQGFTSDHLEVLYDLDVDARRRAEGHGLRFARSEVVNAARPVMDALADRVAAVADRLAPRREP